MTVRELMTQAEIARRARISHVSLSYIVRGQRSISRKMAEDLEAVTTVSREAWMWPERWFNPYVETSSPLLCEAEVYAGKKEKK